MDYRNRYYSPQLRRFIEPDPIGFEGGMNLYAYVGNDPGNAIDPYGLEEWQFHERDHGGPHFQRGASRYNAKTLEPIPHKGKIPEKLSKTAIKGLRRSGSWAKYLKFTGKVGSGIVAIFIEAAFPDEAYAPPPPPYYYQIDIPLSSEPLPLLPEKDSTCP